MAQKYSIYPKTSRVGASKAIVTEKIDGSNLTFFKFDNVPYIATRNNVVTYEEWQKDKSILGYKGLMQFLDDNAEQLFADLNDFTAICGEWVGMGKLKYSGVFTHRFLAFAKARVEIADESTMRFSLFKLRYILDELGYAFVDGVFPNYLGKVPQVKQFDVSPTIEALDELYDTYRESVNRDVEGFVVFYSGQITKYVRMKNGKLEPHQINYREK